MTTIRHRGRRRPFVAGAAVFAALAFSVTACSGSSGADGDYVKIDGASKYAVNYETLKVEGENATFGDVHCDSSETTELATISNDQSQITWIQSDSHKGTDPLTVASSTIGIKDDSYVAADSDQGKAIIAAMKTNCASKK